MKKDWWKKFFGEEYINIWSEKYIVNTKKEVDFIIKSLKLRKKDKILDLGCGHGRHAIALAKKGFKITGVDYSSYSLNLAKKLIKNKRLKLKLFKKDMRKIDFKEKFDVVLNIFTSFGYFSDKDNERVIKNISWALKKKGRFFIDLMNLYYILRNYKEKDWQEGKNWKMLIERRFDPLTSRNYDYRTIFMKNKTKKLDDFLRFYSFNELKELLNKYGLRFKKVFGSFEGDKFSLDSKRMIIISEKK